MEILRNPSRSDVGELLKRHGTARAIRDPASGELHVWGSDLGFHVDVANHLDLAFKTRQELQAHSFIIHDLKDFDSLAGSVDLG